MGQLSRRSYFLALSGLMVLMLAGCGGTSSARAGAISATAVNGAASAQLASLGVGQATKLTMTPSGDVTGAGVDWTVTCGGSPLNGSITGGACGQLAPAHTSDTGATIYTAPPLVPYLTNVTIAASVTSNPSAKSTLTLPIVALPIAVSLTTPPPGSLAAGQTAGVAATILNDTTGAGVTWSATCGSADCGSFSSKTASNPNYTAPATVPADGIVTLTATSIADTTKSASATVTIVAPTQLAVTITSTLPTTLAESATASLSATVANDPANLGVDWTASCGSEGGCGTFNLSPAHTASGVAIVYTAPAAVPSAGTVTITATATAATATNPATPASAITTIVAGAPAVTLTQAPPATVTATNKVSVAAKVTNDVAPGGVLWSVQCADTDPGACGYVTPVQTADGATASYVAPPVPPSGTVTVTATSASAAFTAVSAVSSPVTIAPYTALSINFIPFAPAQVTTGSTVNLTAAVTNDATNAGVDWQVCASGCGFFTTQAAIPEVPATPTTPLIPAVPAVTSTSVQGWPNGLPIPYTAPDAVPQSVVVAISATAHANTGLTVGANVAVTRALTGPSVQGVVQAGTQPVVGAQVALYAAGTTGYASQATQLAVTGTKGATGSDGSFTLPAGYVCPAAGQVYLVATGGKVGSFAVNPNLSMMTALGPCSNLGSTPVVINEVTTVASVWPLAQFSTNQPLTGLSGSLNLGTSSSNTVGLGRAFATVNNLVDVTTGQARYNVPTGNAAVPYVEINTIADALNACTVSAGGQYGDGSPCGTLFAATAPLYSPGNIYNSIAPTDTAQAAFNAAQHPSAGNFVYQTVVSGATGLYSLVSAGSPFQPILTSAPNDIGISLHYAGAGGLTSSSNASSIAIDGADNLWISATAANQVIELNSNGAAISPAGGFTAAGNHQSFEAPGPIAIDTANNVWIADSNSLAELSNNGLPAQGSPFYGVANGLNLAIDGFNNVWITGPGGVTEYNYLGAELLDDYAIDGISNLSEITIDPSDKVWVGYSSGSSFDLAELSNPAAQLLADATLSSNTTQNGLAIQTPLVSDASGDIWSTPANSLCKLPPYNGPVVTGYVGTCTQGNATNGNGTLVTIYGPNGIALDGAGNLWIANAGSTDPTIPTSPNLTEIIPSQLTNGATPYGALNNQSLGVGTLQVALDGAGNAWVLLSDSSVTEFVGVAVPTATPLAAAIANKKVGKTP